MEWKAARAQLLTKRSRRGEYEKIDLAYEIGKMITDARIARNITQAALAERVGTRQPSIARIEKGGLLPSLSFLERIAQALNTQLLPPQFEFMHESSRIKSESSQTSAFDSGWMASGSFSTWTVLPRTAAVPRARANTQVTASYKGELNYV